MAGIYTFKTSRLSYWALWLSRLSIPVALLSFLLLRFGDMHPSLAIYCFAAAVALAILSLLVSLAALPAIWIDGHKGGRRLWSTLFRALLVLLPALLLIFLYFSRPVLSDVTTAPLDPPEFVNAWAERHAEDNDLAMQSLTQREQQALAYPELKSQQYDHAVPLLFLMVRDAMLDEKWTIVRENLKEGIGEESFIEADIRSIFTGLRYALVVRFLDDEDEGTIIDMRAASLWGDHDLGFNSQRILGFQAELDKMIQEKVKRYELRLEQLERERRLQMGPMPRAKPKSKS